MAFSTPPWRSFQAGSAWMAATLMFLLAIGAVEVESEKETMLGVECSIDILCRLMLGFPAVAYIHLTGLSVRGTFGSVIIMAPLLKTRLMRGSAWVACRFASAPRPVRPVRQKSTRTVVSYRHVRTAEGQAR
ncbi:hypothetical protein MPH_01385 [Macrophomina phaseolina MS6]|uniref:Uncharacterized protein n=1 Tax=Macrophomina phaseolina (strain MS6) TaxID=1126212 RepID=K2S358_MACPH|nr:hypothetical protein MPH_01385 [Macrophomina phaseolina MS6]